VKSALRLSPLDPLSWNSWNAVYLGHFQQNQYADAANAIRKGIQCNPSFSSAYMFQAGALVKLGRIDEAKAAAARVLALQPGFTIGDWCRALDPVPAIGERLTEALRAAGLPE
jgi:adenylate cyclase